jgi:hypothetical protein
MTTFRQFLETGYATPSGGHLYSKPYPSMNFTPPSDFTTPEDQKIRRWWAWEMGVLDKLMDLVKTGHTPILVSAHNNGKGTIYRYWVSESEISKKWHPDAIKMLQNRNILSPVPSHEPVIDHRNKQEYFKCHEINVGVLKQTLSQDVSQYGFRQGIKQFALNALPYMGQSRLPAFHGTTIMTGR